MDRTERFYKIDQLLRASQVVPVKRFLEQEREQERGSAGKGGRKGGRCKIFGRRETRAAEKLH